MAHRACFMVTVLTVVLLTGCTVGHRITRLPSLISQGDQAAYYALPRTVVTVSFPVSKTEVKEGSEQSGTRKCFDLLGDPAAFLSSTQPLWEAIGLDELPTRKVVFKVTDNPSIASLPEPDPEQIYRVDLDSSWAVKRQLNLVYGPLGVLESGTSFVQDRRVDLSVAFLNAVISTISPLAFGTKELQMPPPSDCPAQLGPCQLAACEIYQARERLQNLPATVLANSLRGDQAEWLEKRYRADIDERIPLFVRQITEKGNVVCAVRPATLPSPQSFEVLQVDGALGFAPGTGIPCLIPHGFQAPGLAGNWTDYDLNISPVANQYSSTLSSAGVPNAHDPTKEQGFYYRVPAVASLNVKKGPEVLTETELVVAQLGFVAALPRQRTYQTNYKITLDPATGALKMLDSSSDSIDPALITSSGTAIAGALEARAEAEAAEAAAKDELALLERERKILEERQKIRDLQKKLEPEEPPSP